MPRGRTKQKTQVQRSITASKVFIAVATIVGVSVAGGFYAALVGLSVSQSLLGDASNSGSNYNYNVNSENTAVCGNGVLEVSEECDDGNTQSCDGCSAVCRNETLADAVDCGLDYAAIIARAPIAQDATLFENTPDETDTLSKSLYADLESGGGERVGLMRFELSNIPKNCLVVGGAIEADITNATGDSYAVYAVTEEWDAADITWNLFGSLRLDTTASMVTAFPNSAATGKQTIPLSVYGVNVVQGWINGDDGNFGPNYGVSVMGDDSGDTDGVQWRSSKDASGGAVLVVECKKDQEISAICGNGIIEGEEECDDGNAQSCDGCSDECKAERLIDMVSCGTGFYYPAFLRGDANFDGQVDLADAVWTINNMHLLHNLHDGSLQARVNGGLFPCLDSIDSNDDGVLSEEDARYTIEYILFGGAKHPAPGPVNAGQDPTQDNLHCNAASLEVSE